MTDTVDSRAVEVRKILESRTFRDTEVLKRLFEYLAQQALKEPLPDLKEYTVGLEAFGKPSDYNPQIDSSVRVQAGKLRQRLDTYYRTEGTEDEWVVELPKGHFNLEFHQRRTTVSAPAIVTVATDKRFRRPWVAAGMVLVLFALVWVIYYVAHSRRPVSRTAWTPAMEELWGPFLADQRPIMVAVGTPLFVKIGNSFFRDPTLNDWNTASNSSQVRKIEQAVGATSVTNTFTYTGIGEAEGAFELERLLLPRGHDLTLQASSDLTWEDIGRYNMIFLGSPKYNPQTLDLPIQQDFEILHGRVENLHPVSGEPQFFEEKWSADRTTLEEGHALISRLPGLHKTGEILVLAGSSTESSRAAVEFVTRPEYVASLVQQMHNRGGIPKWFQAVVRIRFKSKVPIAIELVAIHALK
jgi:hypothetical protein